MTNSPRSNGSDLALPLWRRAVMAYVRREWPGWGHLYARSGLADDARWQQAGARRVRGKLHGYTMELDLGNWSERLSYCLARYHDLPIQLALQQLLRPGDDFVDVGANLGMLTLLARHLVGPTGRVVAVEPNPRLQQRLARLLQVNGLADVRLIATALGERDETAELHEFAGHSGWGSLCAAGPAGTCETGRWSVACRRGDDVLAEQFGEAPAERALALKIDVEGFEVAALRGLTATLANRQPLLLIEIAPDHLARAGYSPSQLHEELAQHGYRGFALGTRCRFRRGRALALEPMPSGIPPGGDALFAPTRGPMASRIDSVLDKAARRRISASTAGLGESSNG